MDYSEEISKLAVLAARQRDKGTVDPVTEELIEGLLTLVKNLSKDIAEVNRRLRQNEEFSESLSMDLFDIQSMLLKKMDSSNTDDDLSGIDLDDFFAQLDSSSEQQDPSVKENSFDFSGDEDDEEDSEDSTFVRCPFCNTLIISDGKAESYECSFCGGTFTKEDIN